MKIKKLITGVALSTVAITSFGQEGKFEDKRDSTEYKTVTINGLTWMQENLKFEMESSIADINQINDSLDKNGDSEKVGYYYSIADIQKATPEGWRLPTKDDIVKLFEKNSQDPTAMFIEADALPYIVEADGGNNSTGFSANKYGSFDIYDYRKKLEQIKRSKNEDKSSYDAFASALDDAENVTYEEISTVDHGWYFKDEYGDIKYFFIDDKNKLRVQIAGKVNNAYFLRFVKDE